MKQSDTHIRREARQWFLRLRETGKGVDHQDFQLWLQASEEHERAFRLVEEAWNATEAPGVRLAEQEAAQLSRYLQAMDRGKAQRRVSKRLGGAAALLCLLLGVGLWLEQPNILQNLTADYSSGKGERRSINLSDGSVALLDADSALAVHYTTDERRVRLLRGAVFFDVSHTGLPFIVETDFGDIRVLGTRFDVRLLDDEGVVTLERGKVLIASENPQQQPILEPGQRARLDRKGVAAVENISIDDALAWHNGRFVFYRARLSDVVKEIERYRPGRIVIVTAGLASERVTGSFSLGDPDAALLSLQASVGFQINTVANRLTILRP
ncbi:FecR domain-containing protein [Phyllobacterium sp. 21LDTY02-6]|uniref:FecR family protein n=1 Tax=Phyllobacterium sp. 21LDTY02-6 TaxID=2944903 RepID=UPI0020203532|nr:FecR domain-containing protein [Phyllobacterium sp. 21LDTY02-6]MCO4316942.1 FecR domain-containing protein [Phyllobacterium sp. 21LDTY02-6]